MDELNNKVPEENQTENEAQNVQTNPEPQPQTNEQPYTNVQPVSDMNYNYNTTYNTNQTSQMTEPMSVGDYLLTMLALLIPCFGIVLYFVWAFGKDTNLNRKNFCRAYLIMLGIGVVLWIVLAIFFMFVAGIGAASYYYY